MSKLNLGTHFLNGTNLYVENILDKSMSLSFEVKGFNLPGLPGVSKAGSGVNG